MMKNLMVAALVAGFAAMTLPGAALAADHDGALPLYPHGAPARGMAEIPASALGQGVPYQQTTNDSVQTVDRWYQANAPKSCNRIAGSGAVQYKCPSGSIVIQSHGGTIISFVPALPHF